MPTQSPVNGCRVFFPGVEWPRLEVNHSFPSSAEVKDEGGYVPTFPPPRSLWQAELQLHILATVNYVNEVEGL